MDYQKNYYEILGIPKDADMDAIKKAYKTLALKYHPDRNKENSAEGIFKSINEANQILSDSAQRNDYDTKSPHGRSYNPFSQHMGGFSFASGFGGFGTDFFDLFSRAGFNMGFEHHRRRDFVEHLDLAINVEVSLADVYANRQMGVKYHRLIPCEDCDFTGFDRTSESFDCDICGARGKDKMGVVCEYCRGTGKVYSDKCSKCGGEKLIQREQEFMLANIASLRGNKTEYLQGYGHHSKYYRGKVGILQLNLIFRGDSRYEIRGNDLYFKLDVHYQDAIDGFTHAHMHLDGNNIGISIPTETKDKDSIKIPGKGFIINGEQRGDLIFDINIIIDYKRLK